MSVSRSAQAALAVLLAGSVAQGVLTTAASARGGLDDVPPAAAVATATPDKPLDGDKVSNLDKAEPRQGVRLRSEPAASGHRPRGGDAVGAGEGRSGTIRTLCALARAPCRRRGCRPRRATRRRRPCSTASPPQLRCSPG